MIMAGIIFLLFSFALGIMQYQEKMITETMKTKCETSQGKCDHDDIGRNYILPFSFAIGMIKYIKHF